MMTSWTVGVEVIRRLSARRRGTDINTRVGRAVPGRGPAGRLWPAHRWCRPAGRCRPSCTCPVPPPRSAPGVVAGRLSTRITASVDLHPDLPEPRPPGWTAGSPARLRQDARRAWVARAAEVGAGRSSRPTSSDSDSGIVGVVTVILRAAAYACRPRCGASAPEWRPFRSAAAATAASPPTPLPAAIRRRACARATAACSGRLGWPRRCPSWIPLHPTSVPGCRCTVCPASLARPRAQRLLTVPSGTPSSRAVVGDRVALHVDRHDGGALLGGSRISARSHHQCGVDLRGADRRPGARRSSAIVGEFCRAAAGPGTH